MYLSALFLAACFLLAHLSGEEKPFVIGQFTAGRLGNQFFEVANALSVALDHGAEAIFPDLVYRTDDDIPLNREMFFWRLKAQLPPSEVSFVYVEHPHYRYQLGKILPAQPGQDTSAV